jgi:hypothetical protein
MNTVSDQLDTAENPPSNRDAIKIIDAAIQALKDGDSGSHWVPDVIEAAQELYRSERPVFQRKRAELKKAGGMEAQITDWTRAVRGSEESSSETQMDELLALVQERAKLFHDPDGACYANFEQGDHRETWPLGSKGFGDWLGYLAYKELGFTPTETTIKTVLCTMRGIALHDGEEHPVYLRSAPLPCGGYMIDLTDELWRAVEVTATGLRVVDQPSVRFIRSGTAAPFPLSDLSGSVDLLWQHVNIPEQDRPLAQAFILESWRPDTPYLMLELCGEQGSAKSSTHERLRQCSDPNTVPLRAAPKNCEDIFVTAANNHQASFENMSGISPKMQDTLCILTTGGGFAKRKLYSDADESVIAVKRPIIANGIQSIATRPDLIDRTIHIELPRILSFKPESELDAAFERDYAKIFGGLLNLLHLTLRALPKAEVKNPPRMADFARLGEAMFLATETDGSFTELYRGNRTDSLQRSLESSPVALALQEFVTNEKDWTGTAKELKDVLEKNHKQEGEGWPKSPIGLSNTLRRLAPALREVGIEIEHKPRTNTQRLVRIYLTENSESEKQSSPSSLCHQNDEISDGVTVVTHDSGTSENQQEDMYPDVEAGDRVVL